MNIHPEALYQVVETVHGVILMNALAKLPNQPGAVQLVIADLPSCAEYLAKYLFARSRDHDMRAAHKQALDGAIVTRAGNLDG